MKGDRVKQGRFCLRRPPAIVLALLLWPWSGCADKDTKPRRAEQARGAEQTGIVIDQQARSVSVPAKVAEQQVYKQLKGAIEYVLVAKGGKEYETVFVTNHSAEEICQAMGRIGLRAGRPGGRELPPRGMPAELFVEYHVGEKTVRRPLDEFVLRVRAEPPPGPSTPASGPEKPPPVEPARPLKAAAWPFTGSQKTVDPETNKEMLQASLTQSIIGLHYSDASSLFQNPRPECRRENIYRANVAALPKPGTPVRIIFLRPAAKAPAGTRRVHVLVGGRLQNVGFATYVQGQARRLKLTGFVRNLPGERVEAVIEGPAEAVAEILDKMRRGRLGARAENFAATDEPPEGDFKGFEVWH